jgi:SAM-dependent methyltransferase
LFDVVTIAPRGLGSAPETTPSHGWVVARKSERSATPEELRRIDLSNALEMSSSIHAFEGIRRQVVDLGAPSDPHDPIGATRPMDEIPSQAFMEAISPQPFSARLAAFGGADRTAAAEITSRVGRERLLEWAHSVALGSDAELRARVPPVPPLAFRRITAAPEEPTFLLTGLVDLAVFFDIYDRTASRQRRKLRVLDFACGCGRLARYLQVMGGVEAYGVDVNPDLVAWCQANLRNMLTGLNGMDPPMPVADAEMDFVYAMSVFTHLPEEPARGWLRDLARVLVPGGVLTLTTHGYTALRAIPNHPLTFHIDESEAISLGERLPVEGFITLPYTSTAATVDVTGTGYGLTFIDPDYIRANWDNADFQLLEQVPGGLRGFQDIITLKRR